MGFEAEASSGAYDTIFQPDSGHPYIKDFAVVFNGLALPYTNGIVVNSNHNDSLTVFKPITEFDRYIPFERFYEFDVPFADESALYDIKNNTMVYYSYAYYFNCVFEPGYNIVKHSYRYRTSLHKECVPAVNSRDAFSMRSTRPASFMPGVTRF